MNFKNNVSHIYKNIHYNQCYFDYFVEKIVEIRKNN